MVIACTVVIHVTRVCEETRSPRPYLAQYEMKFAKRFCFVSNVAEITEQDERV